MPWLPYPNAEGVDDSSGDGHLVWGEEHPSGASLMLRMRLVPGPPWVIIFIIPDQLVLKRYFLERRQAEDAFGTLKVTADGLLLQLVEVSGEEQARLIEEFTKNFG
jgi:hypothetical protein